MNESAATQPPAPLIGSCWVIDDFLPQELALAMRADIDAHFNEPHRQEPEVHQVWNYWYVPDLYTYLRTNPEKVIQREKVEGFMAKLGEFTDARMGTEGGTWPYLSLYIPGCYQNLHNDSLNGRFAFVYSLTRPTRKTVGGNTVVMTEDNPYRSNLANPRAFPDFSESVEPRFNRLVVFDDRVIHGVERIEGPMDPLEGRFVLHGHIQHRGPRASGARPLDQVLPVIQAGLASFTAAYGEASYNFHGPLNVRFTIGAEGEVGGLHVLVDRVTHISDGYRGRWSDLRTLYLSAIENLRFPPAAGPTTVTLPIAFAGPSGRVPSASET